jgi:transposase
MINVEGIIQYLSQMSNNLIIMSKVRTILKMYTLGVSKKSISVRTGATRNTVKKYIRQFTLMGKTLEEIDKLSDTQLEGLFSSSRIEAETDQRKADLLAFFPDVEKALKRKGETREKLWKQYLEKHPDGYRVTQFKLYYHQWSKKVNSSMHMEHKSGDKMYVDYTGDKLSYLDKSTGEIVPVEVFVAILGSSQLTYVEASMTQRKEDFIGSCENALHYFGGMPQAIVTDNLKSAVIKSDRYEPTLNEMFRDFVEHYHMTALPAGPYKPKHKALVEGAVKIIYRTIFSVVKTHTCFSLTDVNTSIWAALEAHNCKPLSGRPYSRRQLFEEIEKSDLQTLPPYRYHARRKKVVTVMKNNHVCLAEDKHYYSVPYRYIGKKVTILYSQDRVEIYYRYDCIATHGRDYKLYGYTTNEDHLASKHQFKSDWTPEKFIQRATFIGTETRDYIARILEIRQHPEQAYKTCQGILSFVTRAGGERLNRACRRALHFGDFSYNAIRMILEKRMDLEPFDTEEDNKKMPGHRNVRGGDYYK